MKHLICYSFLLITIISCNSNADKVPAAPDATKKDSIVAAPEPKFSTRDSIVLPDLVVNEEYINDLNAVKPLSKNEIDHLEIKKIDKDMSSAFKYFSKDIVIEDSGTVVLISRAYTEENIAWLMIYDTKAKIADIKQVYYTNSEGFLSIETTIKNNSVIIKTANDFAEKEKDKLITEKFHINARRRFVKD